MSVDVYLGLRALSTGRAARRASKRHVHLTGKPFVVVGYHLPGDPGAPIGMVCGTQADAPHTVVIGEPRETRLRFERLVDFALELNGYLGRYLNTPSSAPQSRPPRHAPQLIVPNQATAQWLCDLMGRRLRYLNTVGENAVHPALPVTGAHLSFFAGQRVPGSSLALALTDVLSQHWQTGQMAPLDANLAAQLAWINHPETLEQAEKSLPAGPIPDPDWETRELNDAIKGYHQLVEAHGGDTASRPMANAINDALVPAWQACWEAIDLLNTLPQADHVIDRWSNDLRQWERHVARIRTGQAHFRRRPRQLQVFRHLTRLERLTANLDREMALDDPLIMASHVASGDALSGQVTRVDRDAVRPTIHITPDLEFHRPAGTDLWWLANPVQTSKGIKRPHIKLTITGAADGAVILTVTQGAVRRDMRSRLPAPGTRIVLSPFGPPEYRPDTMPAELPWTHAEAEDDE